MDEARAEKITVLIVEDEPIFRDAIEGYVRLRRDVFCLVGATDNQEQAIAYVEEYVPDILLLDLVLHRQTDAGVEIIKAIRYISPSTKIIVLTAHSENHDVFPAIQAGATSYILKENLPGSGIADLILDVYQGNTPMDALIARRLLAYFQQELDGITGVGGGRHSHITPREQEVLELIVDRMSNREIAEALVISEKTVKTHVSNLLAKLHVSSRGDLRLLVMADQQFRASH